MTVGVRLVCSCVARGAAGRQMLSVGAEGMRVMRRQLSPPLPSCHPPPCYSIPCLWVAVPSCAAAQASGWCARRARPW